MKDTKRFINDFVNHLGNDESSENIHSQFRAGYCWHFAHILKTTFDRGEVVWAAPFGHFCFKDIDNEVYDIEGKYAGEAFYFIPEHFLGDAINDFKHISTENAHETSREEIIKIIRNYCKSCDVEYDKKIESFLG